MLTAGLLLMRLAESPVVLPPGLLYLVLAGSPVVLLPRGIGWGAAAPPGFDDKFPPHFRLGWEIPVESQEIGGERAR